MDFTLNVGPNHAGQSYFMLGSISGTDPGLDFGTGVHLPLNFDGFFVLTIQRANSPNFPDSAGILDATGSASPGFDTLGPLDPAFAGIELDFAVLVSAGLPTFATNPTRITLVQ